MEPPADPPRFKCPPDFSACLFRPGPPFVQETLQDPSKELWLVRAPAGFSPESLDGHSMPLLGFQTLKASQPDGTEKLFHVQSALEHLAGAHLLLPAGPHGDQLTCSSPFGGSLSICEKYGDPGGNNQPLFPVVARPAPQIPKGLKQRFLPFGSHPKRPPLSGAAEEPPRKKRKKKKKHRLGEEDSEDQLPLLGTPLKEVMGAGQAEARHQHKADGAALWAVGTQPSSTAVAQNGVLSGETEDPGPLNKKKKRKEDGEPWEEARGDTETRHQHENGTTPLVIDSQPSSAASAQDGLLFGQAEELDPRSKKKKKKRKDDREVREGMAEEAEVTHQCKEEDAVSGAAGSPPETPSNSAAFAQKGLLSGEAEAPGPRSKKKKRKEDREPKEEMMGEAEAASPHQVDGMTPWAVSSQPESEPGAQDGLLSGKMEDPAPSSKKKKRKDREPKEEMWGEAEAASPHQADGTTPWAIGSQPESEPVAQDGLLSGKMEDPAPSSKKKKRKDREPKEKMWGEAEAASPHQVDGTTPLAIGSQPESEPVAQDDLLSGKAEDPAPLSKKKKKRKDDREPKEEMGGEAEAASLHQADEMMPWAVGSQPESEPIAQDDLLSGETEDSAPTSKRKKKKKRKEEAGPEAQGLLAGAAEPHTGEDRLPGTEVVTQDMHTGKSEEKAALLGPIASLEDAAGMLQDFSGPRPTPEDGLVLAAEEPGVGSSSHKGKKKKRKKEKEEAAQDLEGRPAPQEVESQADLDSPLGGGERQEAAPGMEELTQKHKKKKKKEHHRQ